jgi:hypothetical protein
VTQTYGERGRNRAHKVRTTDYLGNKVTVLHYEFNGMRVREWPDGSMLIELRAGRFRSFPATHKWCVAIRNGSALDKLRESRIRHAAGTHEPVTYYVDSNGKIGVPPEPGLEPPDNVTVHTFNTLAEADRLSSLMQAQMYEDFQDDGVATEYFDRVTGWDRSQMLDAMQHGRGRKEREIARLMLEDVDREAADRQRIATRASFHYRDYDH